MEFFYWRSYCLYWRCKSQTAYRSNMLWHMKRHLIRIIIAKKMYSFMRENTEILYEIVWPCALLNNSGICRMNLPHVRDCAISVYSYTRGLQPEENHSVWDYFSTRGHPPHTLKCPWPALKPRHVQESWLISRSISKNKNTDIVKFYFVLSLLSFLCF